MKWGIRKNPKGPKSFQKGYENFKKNLTTEQRRKNDADVETWRHNAKRSKGRKFNWGPLGKDLVTSRGGNPLKANYKILDYYSRNGKSFYEDHQDRYLKQWTSQLAIDGVDYARLGKKYLNQ